jgi:threonine/homoserine/homoserine lactone efflux protein
VLNAIGLVVNGVVILMASRLGRLFSAQGRWRRLPQMLLATVFAGLAVRLAFDSRR